MDASTYRDQLLECLWACAAACEYCADKYQENLQAPVDPQCIRVCRDCSDACVMTARFLARHSPYLMPLLSLCTDLCEACIRECPTPEAPYAQECAEACNHCIAACREYEAAYTG